MPVAQTRLPREVGKDPPVIIGIERSSEWRAEDQPVVDPGSACHLAFSLLVRAMDPQSRHCRWWKSNGAPTLATRLAISDHVATWLTGERLADCDLSPP